MAEHQLPKLNTRVRFPSPAPLQLFSGTMRASIPRAVSTRAFAASAAARPRNGPSVTRCQVPLAVSSRLDAGFEARRGRARRAVGPPPSSPGTIPPGRGTRGGWRGAPPACRPFRGHRRRRGGLPSARAARRDSRREYPSRRPEPPSGEGVDRSRSWSSAARSGSRRRRARRRLHQTSPEAPRGGSALPTATASPRTRPRRKPPLPRVERVCFCLLAISGRPTWSAGAPTPRRPSPSEITRRVASARVSRALFSSASPARMVCAL